MPGKSYQIHVSPYIDTKTHYNETKIHIIIVVSQYGNPWDSYQNTSYNIS